MTINVTYGGQGRVYPSGKDTPDAAQQAEMSVNETKDRLPLFGRCAR